MKISKLTVRLSLVTIFSLVILSLQLKATYAFFDWKKYTPIEVTKVEDKNQAATDIQVALLLDTSNSMDGLIEQAKSQLWGILKELIQMEKNGQTPKIQIGLYEYGNTSLSVRKGYIRQVLAFTDDMDIVSEKLFGLSTNGGDEYCTNVIEASLKQLNWSQQKDGMRLVYIAGNESFLQGSTAVKTVLEMAKQKDVEISTIFCGSQEVGVRLGWKMGVTEEGAYFSINQDQATVYHESPFDMEIGQLNEQLNQTYVPYGTQGLVRQQTQVQQDQNAGSYSKANMVDRAAYKASSSYSNASWDLLDAYKNDKAILKKKELLPDSLQTLTIVELEAKIEVLGEQRQNVQTRINDLSQKRQAFIAKLLQENAEEAAQSLGASTLESLKKIAKQKGYEVPK